MKPFEKYKPKLNKQKQKNSEFNNKNFIVFTRGFIANINISRSQQKNSLIVNLCPWPGLVLKKAGSYNN